MRAHFSRMQYDKRGFYCPAARGKPLPRRRALFEQGVATAAVVADNSLECCEPAKGNTLSRGYCCQVLIITPLPLASCCRVCGLCAQSTQCPTSSPIPHLQRPGQLHHSALAAATYFAQRCGIARLQPSDRHCCSLHPPSAYQHGRRTGLHLPVNSRRRLGGGYRCVAGQPGAHNTSDTRALASQRPASEAKGVRCECQSPYKLWMHALVAQDSGRPAGWCRAEKFYCWA